MVGVYADLFLFGTEWVLTNFEWFQLMVALQVGPAPHTAVDYMRETFAVGHLELFWGKLMKSHYILSINKL